MDLKQKQEEFLRLYQPCRASLVRFARAMAGNREDALDLVQETTLRAFDSYDKLKNPQAIKSYLFTIASRIYKRAKWRGRHFAEAPEGDEENGSFFDNVRSPESAPDLNHDIEALRAAMMQLPEKQREAVTLFEIIGLTMEEIRQVQGGSLPGVKSRVLRARKKLAKILGATDSAQKPAHKETGKIRAQVFAKTV